MLKQISDYLFFICNRIFGGVKNIFGELWKTKTRRLPFFGRFLPIIQQETPTFFGSSRQ
jgi:hypothetical protein